MNGRTIFFTLIKLYLFKIIISDVSHLSNHHYFQQQYQTFYDAPLQPPQQIHPKPDPPPTISTTTEFFLPEIIINKRLRQSNNNGAGGGYDYNRPTKPPPPPPQHTYLPPPSIPNDPFAPIDIPNQSFPDDGQQIELPNETFIPGLLPSNPEPDNSYLPPNNGINGHGNAKYKIFDNNNNYVTYNRDPPAAAGGYDYNIPTKKPIPPILIPIPADGADKPISDGNQNPIQTDTDDFSNQGYNYEVPISQDTTFPSTPHPILPVDDPQKGYLPPIPAAVSIRHAKDFAQFNSNDGRNTFKLFLKEMRCLNNQGGYFNAIFKLDNFTGLLPIVDYNSLDFRCNTRLIQSHIVVHIAVDDFARCGIRNCGENLCLRLRFPLIQGMKTQSDPLLTLQCKIQDKVISKTHALKMGVKNDIQSRSIGTLAQGGHQQPFRTHIELLRKSPNGFTRQLEPHGAVQLGEELLLRAHVNAGDGWNFTKLTDINLQRISSTTGKTLNTANLVTPYGCINPIMRSICPIQPSFDPPLGHRLSFKVVMFQGMTSGEEIILSMKITGCLERSDCYIDTEHCNHQSNRIKRNSIEDDSKKKNLTEFEEISQISFRVIISENDNEKPLFKDKRNVYNDESDSTYRRNIFLLFGSIGIICFICFLVIIIYLKLK